MGGGRRGAREAGGRAAVGHRTAQAFGRWVALLVLVLLAHRIFYGPQQEGAMWTLFALNFLVLGFVLLAVGLIGEYIGRIYLEVRRRPTYIVRAVHGDESDSPERR